MPMLGQASGGWTESSSALRVLHAGIFNAVGVLTDDSFTQTNPPVVTVANTISDKVDTTKMGVLSGSVAFARPDAATSNHIGGPLAPNDGARVLGVFVNDALGNAFENTPGVASGKNTYMSSCGTHGNALYETQVLTAANAGNDLTAYAAGQKLYASRNGFLTNAIAADFTNHGGDQCYEGDPAALQTGLNGADVTLIAVVKMAPDTVQNELVYDQRI